MEFYKLIHIYAGADSAKALGYYATRDDVQKAKEYYLQKPGFSDFPGGFLVIPRESPWVQRDLPFFETIIYYHTKDFDTEYSSHLGYFPDELHARQAADRFLAQNPGEVPNMEQEIIVNRCTLNERLWPEGFD